MHYNENHFFSNARDLIDRYLVEVKREREEFSKEQLVIAIIDLFAAGRFFQSSS